MSRASFANTCIASPASQLILHSFLSRFTYVTGTSPMSQALHLRHLASRPSTDLDFNFEFPSSNGFHYRSLDIIRVFCQKAGPSLEAEKLRLQFCRRQVFHRKHRDPGCSFTRDLIGAVASRYFPHPTLSLASEQTLKDLERSQGHQRGGEESGFG